MPYRISRDAGLEAIQLYLFVKTWPLDRFISLFISLFFRGIYNFDDVFLPQCQLRRPTMQTSIKFCVIGKLYPFVSFQQINLKQDNFDFQAIFPALSTDLSYNCSTPKVVKKKKR